MESVIAVFDIGKTNKKIFLFDNDFKIVFKESRKFEETIDEDNYPCDDIEEIEKWIFNTIQIIQSKSNFNIKAINFSTHGASLVYLDEDGKRITPLYNYLKPIEDISFEELYNAHGGVDEFSRKTASPAYGMLNSGLQIYWLKHKKPHFYSRVKNILHYPQYLSYLLTNKITADFTSIGAHTALWDFDNMSYHQWVNDENICLPEPSKSRNLTSIKLNNQEIVIGSGLHDSSASIIPLLIECNKEFILLSTGTWIITMNPFSKERLTSHQLKNDCLCFMTPDKQQIKSSMQFLGQVHESYLKILSKHYNVEDDFHLSVKLNKQLCKNLLDNQNFIMLSDNINKDFNAKGDILSRFETYHLAYHQLVFEISKKVVNSIDLILDSDNHLEDIYISGGFNKNELFIHFLKLFKPNLNIIIPNAKDESALGAALLMKDYI